VQRTRGFLAAIEELQLTPAVTLNGVRYFDAESVERIQERINHHGATAPAAAGAGPIRARTRDRLVTKERNR